MVTSRTIRFSKRNTIDCLEFETEQNMRQSNVIKSFIVYKWFCFQTNQNKHWISSIITIPFGILYMYRNIFNDIDR